MSDSAILHRYAPKVGAGFGTQAGAAEADAADDLGAFGWLRGIRDRAVMLELRKINNSFPSARLGHQVDDACWFLVAQNCCHDCSFIWRLDNVVITM